MASTQQDSVMMESASGSHEKAVEESATPTKAASATPTKEEMLEMQRKYYFGAEDSHENSNNAASENTDSVGLDDEAQETSAKMPVVQVSANIGASKPLDSIVELNYEASSDEDQHV